jgi:phosphoribosylformylglycinamidine (FGAM) synthase-like enzyme
VSALTEASDMTTNPPSRHRELGLTDSEYELILERLGREPADTELAMLSLMWSEHCAYKHSKKLLRRLPTEGPHVLMGPGENAGVVDVGHGLGLAFKVESHNHPSAVEPFQGAATGVGGILRDVFAVGARPIAVLDSLRFGEPATSERSRYLLDRAVAGIGHYGNSIGVPTVGGEIYFESTYEQNCLVNAMCLGIAPHERLIRSAAAGPGNVLVLLGALTGRDGIGGASVLASAELGDGDAAKRPSVQIGDPFAEKVAPARVDEVLAVCRHWETLATPIGVVTDSGRLRVLNGDTLAADLPVGILVDECPLYDLAPAPPQSPIYAAPAPLLDAAATPAATLLALLGGANLASRRPVFEQYDPVVQSRTVRRPEQSDAAVLALPDGSAIAVSIDGNGRRVACDPRRGAAEAVYECAANLACAGAEPLGLTNCLNFGNPEKPHVAWQLTESVEGIAEACEALGVPVIGGNVSLYNEAPAGPIFPTPVIGMVGRLPDAARAGQLGFAVPGDAIAVVGDFAPTSAGSELAKLRGDEIAGPLPPIDEQAIRDAHEVVRRLVSVGAVHSAHDIAEGGLAVALAECCVAGRLGARVWLPEGVEPFAEAPGRAFVVSGSEEELTAARLTVIGRVGGEHLEIEDQLNVAVFELHEAREHGLVGFL